MVEYHFVVLERGIAGEKRQRFDSPARMIVDDEIAWPYRRLLAALRNGCRRRSGRERYARQMAAMAGAAGNRRGTRREPAGRVGRSGRAQYSLENRAPRPRAFDADRLEQSHLRDRGDSLRRRVAAAIQQGSGSARQRSCHAPPEVRRHRPRPTERTNCLAAHCLRAVAPATMKRGVSHPARR